MIQITNLDTAIEPNTKHLKIEFRYLGEEPKKISVKIYETFFNLGFRAIGGEIEVKNGNNYWVGDVFNQGLVYRINDKIKISFDEIQNNNQPIYQQTINIGNTNLPRRSMGRDMSIKNIWFISDSNGHHYFSKFNYNSDDFFFKDKVLIPIDIPELSVNRFVNSRGIDFLHSLPLLEGDTIILNLGEIDCRVSFFRNAKNKNKNLIEHIQYIVDRYVDKLKQLIEIFEGIEFIICLPHPPLREGWLREEDNMHLLDTSTEKDRLFIKEFFSRYLTEKLFDLKIKIINPFLEIEDKYGFIKNEFLLPFDNHTRDNEIVLNELKCLI